ncbi:MAG: TonB-dependent receptor plug domain-containing protein [Sandaracinaceae bacterium]
MGALAIAAVAAALLATPSRAQEDAGRAPVDAASAAPVMVPPRLLEAPPVMLPEGAEPLPEGVGVELVLTIAADGTVRDATLAALVREDVDALVLEAARAMRFEPAMRDGTAIPARVRFRYTIAQAVPDTARGAESETGTETGAESEAGAETESETGTASGAEAAALPAVDPDTIPDEELAAFGARATVDRPEAGAASRITLTGTELSTVPGTFGEPLRVVATLPGVVRSPFGVGFFLVRGANFQNTGFFVDGFPVPILYHFGAGPAVISSRLVTRLRFYPGGYPVNLGRYSAGVVALETGIPDDVRSFRFEAEVDLLRASALAVIPFENGNVSIAFRRSYYELLLPLFVQGLQVSYTDYQLRGEYRFDDHLSVSLFAFGSDDLLDQSGALMGGATSEGANTRINYNFQRLIARLDWRLGPDSFIRLSGALGRNGTSFGSRQAGQAQQQFDIESFELGLRLDASIPVAPWLRTNFGVDAAANVFGIGITAPSPTGLGEYPRPVFDPFLIQLNARVARSTPGIYAEGVIDLDPVEISLGMRLDLLRWGTLTEISPDPRAVVRWELVPEVTVKAASGLFMQPPIAFQTISQGGNPNLGPQRAWQNSVGVEADLPLDIDLEVNGFYSHMFDIARFSQQIVMASDGTPRREFFRADQEGRAYGLEVLIRRPVEEGFYGWLSYTLSRSERLNPGGEWRPFGFDQTHVLNLAASYAFDGWRFGASFQLATGRPSLSPTNPVYDSDENAYDATFVDRGERLPVYHQLNVRIDRDFDVDFMRGTVYLDVLNVYYGQNSEGVVYQYDYARSVPIPGLPILGTLGIRAIFE